MGKWFSWKNNEEFAKQIDRLNTEKIQLSRELYNTWHWYYRATKVADRIDEELLYWNMIKATIEVWMQLAEARKYEKILKFLKSIEKQMKNSENPLYKANEDAINELHLADSAVDEFYVELWQTA